MACILFRCFFVLALFAGFLLAAHGEERDETGTLQDMGGILQSSKIQLAPDMQQIGAE